MSQRNVDGSALVPTRLQRGDTLASLATLYGVSARTIATVWNDAAAWSVPDVNAWVLSDAVGGVMLPTGWAAFQEGSVIWLPVDGPRPSADEPPPPARPNPTAPTGKRSGGILSNPLLWIAGAVVVGRMRRRR